MDQALRLQDMKELKNAIVVFENNGKVDHRFCTQQEAETMNAEVQMTCSGLSVFTFESEAELTLSVSPNIQERLRAAKQKLRSDIALRDDLDSEGVPKDRVIRSGIYKAIKALQTQNLLSAL